MDEMLEFLKKVKFDKQLKKMNKKFKNKTVVIYGTGLLFQTIISHYDLSELNIIGISDKKYSISEEGDEELGYKIIPLDKISNYKPDYVLIGALKFLPIIYDFTSKQFKNTKIKVLPLADKPILQLLKEVFD